MTNNTLRLGQGAMRAMEEAILSALSEGECLGPSEIGDRTGIYKGGERPDGTRRPNDVIVLEMLFKLLEDGRVRRCTQRNGLGGWELDE